MARQTSTYRGSRRHDLALGAGIAMFGMIGGGVLFAPGGVQAQAPGARGASDALPAIALKQDEVALVAGNAGVYWIVNARGGATPVFYRESDAQPSPADRVLLVP